MWLFEQFTKDEFRGCRKGEARILEEPRIVRRNGNFCLLAELEGSEVRSLMSTPDRLDSTHMEILLAKEQL